MGATRELAEYVVQSEARSIPKEVSQFAKLLILDQLGCQIAGVEMPWSQRIYAALAPSFAPGGSAVMGTGDQFAPDAAAFFNSTFGHSNESDDTHLKTPTHPGAVAIPAAIAVGQSIGATGADVVAAVIVGYEVMLRISYAVSPSLMDGGHHPPPAVGPFGAAASAAFLYGLDVDETVNAFGIAGSFSGGLLEYTQTGGSVKRLHCAIPSQSGIKSALLARAGVTGPPTILEGKRGFAAVFARESNLAWMTKDLGSLYLTLETSIKRYSCCHLIHAALDVFTELKEQRGLGPDDIEKVTIYTRSYALVPHVGAIKHPTDILGAQFSMSFSIAMLMYGYPCGWWDFRSVSLDDEKILALSDRISTVLENQDVKSFYTGLRIVIELTDGEEIEIVREHAHGEPEDPLSQREVLEKFERLAGPLLGDEIVADFTAKILSLDEMDTLPELPSVMAVKNET